jgi:hypothetical protein
MTVLVEGQELLKCSSCIAEVFESVLADHVYDEADESFEDADETASDEEYRRQMAVEEAERQAEAEEGS